MSDCQKRERERVMAVTKDGLPTHEKIHSTHSYRRKMQSIYEQIGKKQGHYSDGKFDSLSEEEKKKYEKKPASIY